MNTNIVVAFACQSIPSILVSKNSKGPAQENVRIVADGEVQLPSWDILGVIQ